MDGRRTGEALPDGRKDAARGAAGGRALPDTDEARDGTLAWRVVNVLLHYLALGTIALLTLAPFLWTLSTSLKVGQDVFAYPPSLIPHPVSLENYVNVFRQLPLGRYYWNSTVMTAEGVLLNILLAALAAYPLALLEFPGKTWITLGIFSLFVIPNGAGFVPVYLILRDLHLLNTLTGVVLPGAASVLYIGVYRQNYITVPRELLEAARIDGAGEVRIFRQVVFPLVKPATAVVGILSFIGWWNQFLWPIIVLNNSNKYPLTAGLSYLNGMFAMDFGQIAAGAILSVIPVIVLFMILQRQFVSGLTGAIKF